MSNTIEDAITLFAGNPYAVGTEEGGATRWEQGWGSPGQWWRNQLLHHFQGDTPIGVYPMMKDGNQWGVGWGCIDFDEGEQESWEHARNVTIALDQAQHIRAWPERSRSKGWHVWVFANLKVPAKVMREALLAACQIVDAPTREINPKQTTLGEGQLGNYVRLPYPGMRTDDGYHRVVHDTNQNPLTFWEFVPMALNHRVDELRLRRMADLYQPPPPPPTLNREATGDWQRKLGPVGYTMVFGTANTEGGPLDADGDRSAWLWRLMNKIIDHGEVTQDQLIQALLYAHDTYMPDKFGERAETEISRMVGKATR